MALFSKWFKPKGQFFSAREMQFNRSLLLKDIGKLQEELFERKDDPSHHLFVEYLQKLLNLEVLSLSDSRERSADAYAFARGRVEGIRHAINTREEFIVKEKAVRAAKGKKTQAETLQRPYFRQPPMSVGMSD